MRYLYLAVISIILFESCSVTKRKYLPGYSVNWSHREPRVVITKNNTIQNIAKWEHHHLSLPVKKSVNVSLDNAFDKLKLQSEVNFPNKVDIKNIRRNLISIRSTAAIGFTLAPNVNSEPPLNAEGQKKEVCKQAKVSMHTGMYSLTVTLFSLMLGLMFLILKNGGGFWASTNLVLPVILGGAISGGALGIIAIVFGIIALHKISRDNDLYTGKKKAVTGIVFASILLGILALVVA